MIISRTPLRMSFAGGGSDLPGFYQRFGGAVLSTSINKYVFVTVNKKFDTGIRVAYSRTEEVEKGAELQHSIVRAALKRTGIEGGIEITTIADVPSKGTGLGSSSSFTVALLHALHAFQGRHSINADLADQACDIEINVCGEPIGKQDQYAAACGGLNLIEFHPDETVAVMPIIAKPETVKGLRSRMLMLYTGMTRSASTILSEQNEQVQSSEQKQAALKRMVELCYELRKEIQNNNLHTFGEILHENWMLKKSLTENISNSAIDDWYETARRHGAVGGKVLGAGAGGFLLLDAPPERHARICHALPTLRPIDFEFDRSGSQIIFYQPT